MNVALVCPYALDRVGGVQSHVRALASTLGSRGHEVALIGPRSTMAEPEGFISAGRAVGIPANGSVAPLAFGPGAALAVRRAVTELEPDVLHLHEPLIPSTSLLALEGTKVPAVGTFHASAESSFGYRIARPVLEHAARRLAVRTAVSDAARDFAMRYFPGEYALTPNGVDIARFENADPLALGDEPVVLFVGRLERRKGLEVLIHAMARLSDVDATLVVAGEGSGERSAQDLSRRLGVRTEFLGRLSEEDLPRVYRAATVYCAPGTHGESFGIVLIEAMAAGAPVVCSDLPGYRAVAAGAAQLAEPGDAAALATALRRTLQDDDERARMSKASKTIARAFDWRRLAANVEAVYERAAG